MEVGRYAMEDTGQKRRSPVWMWEDMRWKTLARNVDARVEVGRCAMEDTGQKRGSPVWKWEDMRWKTLARNVDPPCGSGNICDGRHWPETWIPHVEVGRYAMEDTGQKRGSPMWKWEDMRWKTLARNVDPPCGSGKICDGRHWPETWIPHVEVGRYAMEDTGQKRGSPVWKWEDMRWKTLARNMDPPCGSGKICDGRHWPETWIPHVEVGRYAMEDTGQKRGSPVWKWEDMRWKTLARNVDPPCGSGKICDGRHWPETWIPHVEVGRYAMEDTGQKRGSSMWKWEDMRWKTLARNVDPPCGSGKICDGRHWPETWIPRVEVGRYAMEDTGQKRGSPMWKWEDMRWKTLARNVDPPCGSGKICDGRHWPETWIPVWKWEDMRWKTLARNVDPPCGSGKICDGRHWPETWIPHVEVGRYAMEDTGQKRGSPMWKWEDMRWKTLARNVDPPCGSGKICDGRHWPETWIPMWKWEDMRWKTLARNVDPPCGSGKICDGRHWPETWIPHMEVGRYAMEEVEYSTMMLSQLNFRIKIFLN